MSYPYSMKPNSNQRYEVNAWQTDSRLSSGRGNLHTKRFGSLANAQVYLATFTAVGNGIQYFSGEILDRTISPGLSQVVGTL